MTIPLPYYMRAWFHRAFTVKECTQLLELIITPQLPHVSRESVYHWLVERSLLYDFSQSV